MQSILKKCGLPDNVLRRVWTGAKRPEPPLNLMCEAEFLRACELVVAAGGTLPGEATIRTVESASAMADVHNYNDPLTSSESEQEEEADPREQEMDKEVAEASNVVDVGTDVDAVPDEETEVTKASNLDDDVNARPEEENETVTMSLEDVFEGVNYDEIKSGGQAIANTVTLFQEIWLTMGPEGGSILEGTALVALEASRLPKAMLKMIVAAAKEHDSPAGSLREEEFNRACTLVEEAGGVPLQHPDKDGVLEAIWLAADPKVFVRITKFVTEFVDHQRCLKSARYKAHHFNVCPNTRAFMFA